MEEQQMASPRSELPRFSTRVPLRSAEVWSAHSESKVCEAVSTNFRFPLAGNNGSNPANVSSVASHRITSGGDPVGGDPVGGHHRPLDLPPYAAVDLLSAARQGALVWEGILRRSHDQENAMGQAVACASGAGAIQCSCGRRVEGWGTPPRLLRAIQRRAARPVRWPMAGRRAGQGPVGDPPPGSHRRPDRPAAPRSSRRPPLADGLPHLLRPGGRRRLAAQRRRPLAHLPGPEAPLLRPAAPHRPRGLRPPAPPPRKSLLHPLCVLDLSENKHPARGCSKRSAQPSPAQPSAAPRRPTPKRAPQVGLAFERPWVPRFLLQMPVGGTSAAGGLTKSLVAPVRLRPDPRPCEK